MLLAADFLVLRLGMFIKGYYYYKNQGADFVRPLYPIFGNFLKVSHLMSRNPKLDHSPFRPMLEDTYGKNKTFPEIVVCMMQQQPMVVINSARMLTDVYVTKNKYFDKDPISRVLFGSIFGESIVLAASDELWSKKRKVLSQAFYKDKLIKMTEVIRQVVAEKITEIERDHLETGKPMDVVAEMGDLHMRVIFVSAFGLTDLHKVKLPYAYKGGFKQLTIGDYLRNMLSFMIFRTGRKIFALIPYLMFFNYCQEDKEYAHNIK